MLEYYAKETPVLVFSSEICQFFKNTYFEEHPRTAASGNLKSSVRVEVTCLKSIVEAAP